MKRWNKANGHSVRAMFGATTPTAPVLIEERAHGRSHCVLSKSHVQIMSIMHQTAKLRYMT